ncbi:MAG: aldose 1-epimerase [Lutibacter sp.]|uniref:aldose 1-epimerase n=1 Tax=Lutibacter sp. TaxID=1925666 RepID=UPI00299F41E4|nr:aldose 1-epimerase [Lutibacter sp.]MDX1829929.1 aldose 1-epimerase [Lutibacter sp.]
MYKIKIIENKNSFLEHIKITNDLTNLESLIYPNLGASIQKLNVKQVTIIDGIHNKTNPLETYKNRYNSSLLFPFPNRIENGKYSFKNEDYQLICNEADLNNALHGHVFNKAFTIDTITQTENHAKITLSYNYNGNDTGFPFPYQLIVTYTFSENNITIHFNVLNTGKKPFPFGIGWHPYFCYTTLQNCILDFESSEKYLLSDKMIPLHKIPLKFSVPIKLNKPTLDDCFITKSPKVSLQTDLYDVTINYDQTHNQNYLQVYTPENNKSIAIEPMTCAPNIFNLKDGLLKLNPNEEFNLNINIAYALKSE